MLKVVNEITLCVVTVLCRRRTVLIGLSLIVEVQNPLDYALLGYTYAISFSGSRVLG